MQAKSKLPMTPESTLRKFRPTSVIAALFVVLAMGSLSSSTSIAFASDEEPIDAKALATENSMALPDTYLVTVTLEDFDQTLAFSTLTAQRHFSLAPAERLFQFRGRLWLQGDGRELLDFSIEFHQELPAPESRRPQSRAGNWSGSTYLELGLPIQVVKSPDSKITVTLQKR